MLNLGLALERPYESKYNAYRRFLIANGKKSLGDMRDELRKKFEPSYARYFMLHPKINTFQLFQLLDHNARYDDLELDTRNIVKHIPDNIRNCPECSRSCFHSDLYQFTWLTHCPIHHQPLCYSCPTCEKSWPVLGQMKTRRCKTCGTSQRWNELKEANAFILNDSNSRKLGFLYDLIKDFNTLTRGSVVNLHTQKHLLDQHSSISVYNWLFPSIMSMIYPSITSMIKKYGIQLYDLKTARFPAKFQPVTQFTITKYHYYDANLDSECATNIRKQMEIIIKNEIKNKFNISDLTFPEDFYFGERRYIDDILYLPILAFNIWKQFVDGKGLICNELFKQCNILTPSLLKTLIFDEENLFEIQYRGKIHVEYTAPIMMQTLMYKYDLWHTFTDILRYLDAIRYLNIKNDYRWNSLDDLTPGVFAIAPSYAFFLINRKHILFFYPDECCDFSLKDFATLK